MQLDDISRIAKVMMMLMEDNGIIIDDHEKLKNFIFHAFKDDRVRFFIRDAKVAGFVMWEALQFGDGYDLRITHLLVLPQFRPINIFTEMKSIRKRYHKIYKVKFHRQIGREFIPKVRYLQKELIYERA